MKIRIEGCMLHPLGIHWKTSRVEPRNAWKGDHLLIRISRSRMPAEKMKQVPKIGVPAPKSTEKTGKELHLVYRSISHKPESLVFSSLNRAYHVHCISMAIETAKTWGEFIKLLPPGEWQLLSQSIENEDPAPESLFNAEQLPGFSDGDYPPWLQAEMGEHVPADLLEEFGIEQDSVINGSHWRVLAENEIPLVERLVELGFTVTRKEEWNFH